MASRLSDSLRIIESLKDSARLGDWKSAGNWAALLRRQPPPDDKEQLAELLQHLREALIAARASRALSVASLARLNAAARFNYASVDLSRVRQNFDEPTYS